MYKKRKTNNNKTRGRRSTKDHHTVHCVTKNMYIPQKKNRRIKKKKREQKDTII